MTREGDIVVGGLSCSEVVERLSSYLDDELPAAERDQVEAHLAGCDRCSRFGAEFRAVVDALRTRLSRAGRIPGGFHERLRRAMDAASR